MSIPKPDVPGGVFRFTGSTAPRIPPSASNTVALTVVADWGPVVTDSAGADNLQGGPQLCLQFSEFTSLFGDSDTRARTAAAGAFAGQGLPGQGGAGAVLIARLATTGQLAATHVVTNTTPATTLTLFGYYKGTRGNRISYGVDADPSNSGRDRLRIYFDGVPVDSYIFDPATMKISDLVAAINKRSRLVKATAQLPTSAVRLTQVAPTALAAGNDGTSALQNHLDALEILKFKAFGVLAADDIETAPLQAGYYSWLQAEVTANRPVRLVVGGGDNEVLADATTRSALFDDEHVVNVGIGQYHDALIGKDVNTAQLSPRIAGIIAAKGETHSATFSEIAGLTVINGPAEDELAAAIAGGVLCLGQTSSPDADLHVVKAVTTFTDQSNAAKPYDVFSDVRLIGIMDDYIRAMKAWGDKIVIGNLPVNDDTRALVRGQANKQNIDLLRAGLILPADATSNPPVPAPWVVCEDPGDPSLRDAIPYKFGWQFAFTANAILGEGQVQ